MLFMTIHITHISLIANPRYRCNPFWSFNLVGSVHPRGEGHRRKKWNVESKMLWCAIISIICYYNVVPFCPNDNKKKKLVLDRLLLALAVIASFYHHFVAFHFYTICVILMWMTENTNGYGRTQPDTKKNLNGQCVRPCRQSK